MARSFAGKTNGTDKLTTGSRFLDGAGAFTVMFWFKAQNLTDTEMYVLECGNPGTRWAVIWEFTSNAIEFYSEGGGPNAQSGPITLADTNWHHICYRKAATGSAEWSYLLDGVKTTIGTVSWALPSGMAQVGNVGTDGGNPALNGSIAEVRYYDVGLTNDEVVEAMRGGHPRPPVFYCPLWGVASPEPDLSGNGKNGTVTGTTVVNGPPVRAYSPFSGDTFWSASLAAPPVITVVVQTATESSEARAIGKAKTLAIGQATETNVAQYVAIVGLINIAVEADVAIPIIDPIPIAITPLTAGNDATSSTTTVTSSIAPPPQHLVLLCYDWAKATAGVAAALSSVTGAGVTWEFAIGQNYGSGAGNQNARRRMEVWRALSNSPGSGAVNITHPESSASRNWSIFEMNSTALSGTNGSGAIRQTATNRGTNVASLVATLGAFGTVGNITVGFAGGANDLSLGAGFTAIVALRIATAPAVSLLTEYLLGADTTVDASQTAGQMGMIGLEIQYRILAPIGQPIEADEARTVSRAQIRVVGQATEADVAQTVTWVPKIRVVARATEADLAQTIVPKKVRAIGQVTETDLAQALAKLKTLSVSSATETDSSQVVAWAPKARLIGQVLEADAIQAVTWAPKARLIGQAVEADLARTVIWAPVRRLVGQVPEADDARALVRIKTVALGIAAESNVAQAVTRTGIGVPVGQVTESDTAQIIIRRKTLAIARVAETDSSGTVSPVRTYVLAQATETDVARTVSVLKVRAVGQALEADAAQVIAWAPKARLVGMTTETDLARAVTWQPKARLIGTVAETDSATVATVAPLRRLVGTSVEADAALPITIRKTVVFGMVSESDLARAVIRPAGVGRASESASASTISIAKTTAVSRATSADTAQLVRVVKPVQLARAVESNTAQVIGSGTKIVSILRAVESNTAQVIYSIGGPYVKHPTRVEGLSGITRVEGLSGITRVIGGTGVVSTREP